jgi:hypothetical protein
MSQMVSFVLSSTTDPRIETFGLFLYDGTKMLERATQEFFTGFRTKTLASFPSRGAPTLHLPFSVRLMSACMSVTES